MYNLFQVGVSTYNLDWFWQGRMEISVQEEQQSVANQLLSSDSYVVKGGQVVIDYIEV